MSRNNVNTPSWVVRAYTFAAGALIPLISLIPSRSIQA